MSREITRTYRNAEIAVTWRPALCAHSRNCFRGLPAVFDPGRRPWVTLAGTDSRAIAEQVGRCPSGALSVVWEQAAPEPPAAPAPAVRVQVTPRGPLLVHGRVEIEHAGARTTREKVTALCRCGGSRNKPYCDGSHTVVGFEG